MGGPCDFGVSPSPFDLDFGTLDFGTSDLGLTIVYYVQRREILDSYWQNQVNSREAIVSSVVPAMFTI